MFVAFKIVMLGFKGLKNSQEFCIKSFLLSLN